MPAGSRAIWSGGAVPAGWLACNGAAVSRTTYANLFAAIGTTYGAGDGSTTFNLPNWQVAAATT
jgi:microcystin-dependent protein